MATPLVNPTFGREVYPFGIYDIGGIREFDTSGFIATATSRLMDTMKTYAERIKSDLEDSVRTWNTPVEFKIVIDKSHDEFSMSVYTENEIFRFVNDGTSVRHAVMTEDFTPKTQPGLTWSRRGTGGLAYVDSRVMKPGIEARNFVETAFETWSGLAESHMEAVFNETISEFWSKALG